nr:hypothetical protein [Tanacetum cinerariifolium]
LKDVELDVALAAEEEDEDHAEDWKFYPAVAQCSLQAIIKWDGNDQATTKNGAKEVLIRKEMVLIMVFIKEK